MERHKHCLYCGVSIPPQETFCSEKCKDAFIKSRRKVILIQRALIVILILLFLLIFLKNVAVL